MNLRRKAVAIIMCAVIITSLFCILPVFASSKRVCIEDDVCIRTGPGTNNSAITYTPLYTLTYGDLLGIEKDSSGNDWYHVKTDSGYEGYVSARYAEICSDTEVIENYERFDFSSRVMITQSVNVRAKPSADNKTSGIIAVQWPCSVKCTGKVRNEIGEMWYNIITPGGLNGYVRSDLVAEYTYNYDEEFEKTLSSFPYNYRDGLRYLHTIHPNWVFKADSIDITLEYAVKMENGRKLLSNNYTSLPETWRIRDVITEPGYSLASSESIRYFMNPENFIVPTAIFMFMQQSFDASSQTVDGVKNIVSKTFLDTDEYIGYIMEAATASKVNPYVLAGTILQEQSIYGSMTCSGNYPGFEGYYNFFNYGASGTSTTEIIESGLTYAKTNGWNSKKTAIVEGAKKYSDGYINDKQDTYYYKNFNVLNKDWGFQYATNIHDSVSNAMNVSSPYDSEISSAIFKIPVFAGSDFEENPVHTHTFDSGVVTVEPQIGITGLKTYTCTGCGTKKTEVIPALQPTPATFKKGDINGDGYINTVDGALLRMYFLEIRDLQAEEKSRADINGDSAVNTVDGALLRMHFLEIKLLD